MTESPDSHPRGAFVVTLASLANGAAWFQSWAQANISTGAVITLCTIVVPAGVGAITYIAQKLGPVLFDFIAKLDAAKAGTLGGQMERLNRNLEDSKGLAESQRRLADIAKQQADRLQNMYESSERRNAEQAVAIVAMTANDAEIKDSLAHARESLHTIADQANGYKLHAETLQAELDEYKGRLGPVIEQVAHNRVILEANQAKVDQVAEFGAKVAEAGAKVTEAASNLPH
jgi:hypothetical protein